MLEDCGEMLGGWFGWGKRWLWIGFHDVVFAVVEVRTPKFVILYSKTRSLGFTEPRQTWLLDGGNLKTIYIIASKT